MFALLLALVGAASSVRFISATILRSVAGLISSNPPRVRRAACCSRQICNLHIEIYYRPSDQRAST